MRYVTTLMGLVSVTLLVGGCCKSCGGNSTAATQTYRHRYGVELTPAEWKARGQDGVVTTQQANGVTVVESLADGVLHGPRSISFPNRTALEVEENYEHGTLVRRMIHDASGFPISLEEFLTPERRHITYWFTSGAPQRVEKYEDGRLVGAECFAAATGELEAKVADGVGTLLCRDPFGTLLSEALIQDGQISQLTSYYPHGTPQEVAHYLDGQLHGQRTLFLATGVPYAVESYVAGAQEGITALYENGVKVAEVPFSAGERHGTERRLNAMGEVTREIGWLHNQQAPTVR
jgi:antitoxin component YwqK of YwqJK toxin-antitoxin module